MPAQDIIVIGGSAGGLEGLTSVLGKLSGNLQAAIFVVLHTSPQGDTALSQILERTTSLRVATAVDGHKIDHGHVYLAPPDHHLTLEAGTISVHRGPRENGFRPAIDPLFRSAAKHYEGRVVGVVLSGALDDGTFGLLAVKKAGGTAIVQHPYDAVIPSMPLAAIRNVPVDHIVRTTQIASLLTKAAESGLANDGEQVTLRRHLPQDVDPTGRDISLEGAPPDAIPEPPSRIVCPECGGSLFEVEDGKSKRFRCHTGHGFTFETLLAAQDDNLEHALWSAVRVLMERAAIHRQLGERTKSQRLTGASQRHHDRAQEEQRNAGFIREMLAALPTSDSSLAATNRGQ